MFHGGGKIIPGGIKQSTEGVKYSTELSNIPSRGLNIARRHQIGEAGG